VDDPAFDDHYNTGVEQGRLVHEGQPSLELVRSLELLERFLPAPPADVLDVGGGPGVYASTLARRGYRVRIVDVLPLHVEQAAAAAAQQPEAPFTAVLGDARALPAEDESQDVVLLLGPLYHLTRREDRVQALREARRVLRAGGLVAGAAVSRFASLLDGLLEEFLAEPEFAAIVERDLREGQHRNPDPVTRPEWFTTAYFHRPEELQDEFEAAGLACDAVLGVEGPGWLFPGKWRDPARRELVLRAARLAEAEPLLRAVSAHLLALGRKP
jgi:ubiquinone/menaquinone biosynthesis C-methylase UbiE